MSSNLLVRVGCLSETGNKAISASIEIEVELSRVEAELGNKGRLS